MPANRSRTERWRECLEQILNRDGGLEIAVDRGQAPSPDVAPDGATDLVWRVRLASIRDSELLVEQPTTMGQPIRLDPGTQLVGAMAIGQNRWMFKTSVIGSLATPSGARQSNMIRLSAPQGVERCQRRSFYRVSTAELRLPTVRCWPLLDPTSVVAAEVANRSQISELLRDHQLTQNPEADPLVLPEVGPPFRAKLVNIGGGGAGLVIERGENGATDRSRALWLRINLMPHIPAPIAVTAKIAHTHIDSGQNLYLGLAFDFAHNLVHKDFVVGQISRYVVALAEHTRQARRAS